MAMDWCSDSGKLVRSGLGRVGCLGELYDARTESFLSRKLFLRSLPDYFINVTDTNRAQIEYNYSDRITDKLYILKVESELHLPLLFNKLSLTGNGCYLQDERNSARSVSGSLHYNITTKHEKLLISYSEVEPFLDITALDDPHCTHFVAGIDWGANCTLTLSSSNVDDKNKTNVEGKIKADLGLVGKLLNAGGEGEGVYKNESTDRDVNFQLKIHADVVPDGKIPGTVEEAIAFLGRVPQLVSNINEGKGKPLSYALIPVSIFNQFRLNAQPIQRIIQTIDQSFVMLIVYFLEELSSHKQRLNDIKSDLEINKLFVDSNVLSEVRKTQQNLEINEIKFKSELGDDLLMVRSGTGNIREMVQKSERLKATDLNLWKLEEFMDALKPVLEKIRFIKRMEKMGVIYLERGQSCASVLHQHTNTEFYILIVGEKLNKDATLFARTLDQFIHLAQEKDKKHLVADLDLGVQSILTDDFHDQIRIVHYKGGKILSYDVLSDFDAEACMNLVRLRNNEPMAHVLYPPVKRVPMKIKCPGFGLSCPPEDVTWMCPRCKDDVEYGFDEHFYCICGKGLVKLAEFRCSNDKHGLDYIQLTDRYSINAELSRLRPFKELNILILGQSGVGKSTWINSIVNYLQYDTLREAKLGGVISVIPASFDVPYGNNQMQEVVIGEPDPNEALITGKSATKGPKTYTTILGDRTVRLVDTPGLGDTGGIDRDKENMKGVLDHISHFKEIHGICILLKSNEKRIDALFKFCLTELLVHLHRNAARNIIFCFTNSRSAFYTAGQTQSVLSKLLEEQDLSDLIPLCERTMFCLDNEAFRLLCTLRYPNIKHKDDELSSYDKSWEISVKETRRLFDQIKHLEPHAVNDTTTLCAARNRILNLTKPIAEITETIQVNLAAIATEERKYENSKESVQKLAKELYFPQIILEPTDLPQPRTVCCSPKCTKNFKLEKSNITQIEYVTHCHVECQLKNVTPETLPNTALLDCWAMNGTKNCRHCGCCWDKHMHITYDQKRVEKKVKNENIESRITDEESAAVLVAKHVSSLKEHTRKLREEEKIIMRTSIQFGKFLRENAIAPYNDGFQDYLNYLISQEQRKVSRTAVDDDLLKGLNAMVLRYKEEVRILNETMAMNADGTRLTPGDITRLEKELYKLEIMGPQIRANAEKSTQGNQSAVQFCEQPLPRKNRQSAAFRNNAYQNQYYYNPNNLQYGMGNLKLNNLEVRNTEKKDKPGIMKKVKNFFFDDFD